MPSAQLEANARAKRFAFTIYRTVLCASTERTVISETRNTGYDLSKPFARSLHLLPSLISSESAFNHSGYAAYN